MPKQVGGGEVYDYQSVRDPELRQELMEIQNLLAQHRLDSQFSSYDKTTTATGTSPAKLPQESAATPTENTLAMQPTNGPKASTTMAKQQP